MAKREILDKKHTIQDGMAIVTKTTRDTFTREELQQERAKTVGQQDGLLRQIKIFKDQYNELGKSIADIDAMISEIPVDLGE